MAQWVSFSVFVAVLTLLLLVLARQSQRLLGAVEETSDDAPGTAPEAAGVARRPPMRPREDSTTDTGGDRSRTLLNDEHPWLESEHRVGETGASLFDSDSPPAVEPVSGGQGPDSTTVPQGALTPAALLANVALTQGLVVLLVLAAAWYFAIPAHALGVSSSLSLTTALGAGALFGTLLWVANELSTAVADAVGAAYDETVREMLSPDSATGWLVLFLGVLPIIAVAEELLFRAALIGVPATGFGVSPWLLAVVSSLAFALGHGAQGTVGVVVTGVLGFVLAAGYVLSGSLLLVVVAHYVINALEFLIHEYAGVERLFDSVAHLSPGTR